MSQVTARLRLEAASMSNNEDKFKEVYAAKMFKNEKKNVGKGPKDQCHIHPNGKHSNDVCYQQKDRSAASASNHQLSDAEVVRRYKALFSAQDKPNVDEKPSTNKSKTAAVAATNTQEDDFITYLAYAVSSSVANNDSSEFLLDTGANTHLTHDASLLHNLRTIKPVFINGIAGTSGESHGDPDWLRNDHVH